MADHSYTLAFKPAIGNFGGHDPSAVIFRNGYAVFGIEEERLTRSKHAVGEFPTNAIRACLDYAKIDLALTEDSETAVSVSLLGNRGVQDTEDQCSTDSRNGD